MQREAVELEMSCLISFFEEQFGNSYQASFGEGNGTPLQSSCLENPVDGGVWKAAVHGVAEGRTRLSNFTFTFTFTHWRRKWQPTPVFLPGESQGQGSLVGCCLWGHTVGHDWSDLAAASSIFKMFKPSVTLLLGVYQGHNPKCGTKFTDTSLWP